jgi:hypothetical protein
VEVDPKLVNLYELSEVVNTNENEKYYYSAKISTKPKPKDLGIILGYTALGVLSLGLMTFGSGFIGLPMLYGL